MSLTIYHHPRCSKSRKALELLRERGLEPRIVLYQESPPSPDEIKGLLAKLGLTPRGLLRAKEAVHAELGLDDPTLDDEALIRAMHEHPVLIERPIVVHGDRAVIGRPPDDVLTIV